MKSESYSTSVDLRTIPNLDPAPFYELATPENGHDRIILPSGHLAYHIKRYEHVQTVLSDRRFIRAPSNEEGAPTVFPTLTPKELLLNTDFPFHQRLKTLVARDFSPTGVGSIRDSMRKIIHRQLAVLANLNGEADLFQDFLDHIPSGVICDFLGLEPSEMKYYRPLSHTVQIASRTGIPELVRQFDLVYQYLLDLIQKKRPSREGGFIKRVIAMRREVTPEFTDEEMVGVVIGVLLGGDQNLLTVMTKVVYCLLAAPALFQQIAADPGITENAVEELLRLIPLGVVSAFPRMTAQDVKFDWGFFPKGSALYPDVFAANRDPSVFDRPYEIDFRRKSRKHLQFGYGMHACMGAALARMEIYNVVGSLARQIPSLRFRQNPHLLHWQDGLILRRPTELPVTWESIVS